jgi:serine/threonine-protein kinase PknG
MTSPAAEACAHPGCDGTVEDLGGGARYCDTCGLAPLVPRQGGPEAAYGSGAAGAGASGGGAGAPGNAGLANGGSGNAGSGNAGAGAGLPHSNAPFGGSAANSTGASGSSAAPGSSGSGRLSGHSSGSGGRAVSVRGSGSAGSGANSGRTRGRLGAGLVSVPPIPRPDPAAAVLADPRVPEHKRFCGRGECGAPVGRGRGGRPGRTEGFCTACGQPYSFTPKLRAGDVVHGQYEVVGCLAHGGLGWIYLAVDRAVSDRWVVLKGLLDAGDPDAVAAAVSERRYLAEIEHPNIVRIYNFVEHLDPRTGSLDGYIVMEYVGGKSLKEIANERRAPDGRREPLPVEQAVAYAVEALEALGHLHQRGLLYCDFKVDNAIQQEDRLTLIDMGAVRRADDQDGAIYGTVGYQAPEVPLVGPSVASDLYTVGRTLAVLTFDFQGYTTVWADRLPDPAEVEVFRRYESFHRLLVRATDPDPARRFATAEEMADQLLGVLREVVALHTGTPRPALSALFGPEVRVPDTTLVPPATGDTSALGARDRRRASRPDRTRKGARGTGAATAAPPAPGTAPLTTVRPGARITALALPVPLGDPGDPHAGLLAGLAQAGPAELLGALAALPDPSVESRLRELRVRLADGLTPGGTATPAGAAPGVGPAATAAAAAVLDTLEAAGHGEDWRVVWHRGVAALAAGDGATAAESFDAVYDAFPGELAPKLALAVCAEAMGRPQEAASYYGLVWCTDRSYVSAAFGLARVLLSAGDRPGAVRALESVPESSIHWTAARTAAVRARLRGRDPREPLLADLLAAAAQVEELETLGVDADRRAQLSAEVRGAALDWVLAGGAAAERAAAHATLFGSPVVERELRFGLEHSYRVLARLAEHSRTRNELVERANRFRPRTWV